MCTCVFPVFTCTAHCVESLVRPICQLAFPSMKELAFSTNLNLDFIQLHQRGSFGGFFLPWVHFPWTQLLILPLSRWSPKTAPIQLPWKSLQIAYSLKLVTLALQVSYAADKSLVSYKNHLWLPLRVILTGKLCTPRANFAWKCLHLDTNRFLRTTGRWLFQSNWV